MKLSSRLMLLASLIPLAGPAQAKKDKVDKPPFFASLPERFTAAKDDPLETALMNAAIDRGVLEWFNVSREITIEDVRIKVTIPISNALKVDDIRINLRYDFAQRLADKLGLLLPTTLVADLVQKNATVRFTPQYGPMQEDVKKGTNTSVSAMIKHSRLVDKQVDGKAGLANNEGKWFVLTKQFWTVPEGKNKSAIYGWWLDDGSRVQDCCLAHELPFADYSQVVRFMGKTATIETPEMGSLSVSTEELLGDPDWAELLSAEGDLPETRHPKVPKE